MLRSIGSLNIPGNPWSQSWRKKEGYGGQDWQKNVSIWSWRAKFAGVVVKPSHMPKREAHRRDRWDSEVSKLILANP